MRAIGTDDFSAERLPGRAPPRLDYGRGVLLETLGRWAIVAAFQKTAGDGSSPSQIGGNHGDWRSDGRH